MEEDLDARHLRVPNPEATDLFAAVSVVHRCVHRMCVTDVFRCFLIGMMFTILFSLGRQASCHPLGLLHDSTHLSKLMHVFIVPFGSIWSHLQSKWQFLSRQSLLQGLRSDFVKYHAQWLASAVITVRVQRTGECFATLHRQ